MPDRAYKAFLKSPQWAIKREQVLTRWGAKCYACGVRAFECHHTTYDYPLGREPVSIFRVLCNRCHREIHQIHRRSGRRKSLLIITEQYAKEKRKAKRELRRTRH